MGYWDNHCYCCAKELGDGPSYFTCEFDAYICPECHDRIVAGNWDGPEEEIIRNEFCPPSSTAAVFSGTLYSQSDMKPQNFLTIFKVNGEEVPKHIFYRCLRQDATEEYADEEDFIASETMGISNISALRIYDGAEKLLSGIEQNYIIDLIDRAYENGGVEINNNLYETIIQGE